MNQESLSRAKERIQEGVTGPKTVEEIRDALGPLMASLFMTNRIRVALQRLPGEPPDPEETLLTWDELAVQSVDMFLILEAKATEYYREIQD